MRSGSASHSISPVGCWWSSAKSIARSTTGNSRSRKPVSPEVEVVVPHAVGDVAGDVGVERVLLDRVALVVRVPRAVEALPLDEPLVRALGLGEAAARRRGPSRLRRGSTGRCDRPATHGMLPSGCCTDAIASIVCATCRRDDHAGDLGELEGFSQGCAFRISPWRAAPSRRTRRGSCRGRGSTHARCAPPSAGCAR